MHDIHAILQSLAELAHPDGGWGYRGGQPAQLEPTCLALLALSLEKESFAPAIAKGMQVLQKHETASGAYRLEHGWEESTWPTGLVLFVQADLGESQDRVRRTASALLGLRGKSIDETEATAMHDIDARLVGWPWALGNFSWVEPTAWACLALHRAGQGDHPRVAEGSKLLLDRAFDDGGVNYGNRRVFGRMTEPNIEPTALLLLALQGQTIHPRQAASVKYLKAQAQCTNDIEHLAWIKLALDCVAPAELAGLGLDEKILAARQERTGEKWLKADPVREALCALALGTGLGNPFKLSATPAGANLPESPPVSKRKPLGQRIKARINGMVINALGKLRQPPAASNVHIAPVADYNADLADVLKRQYESFRTEVPLAGKRVVLKPNLVEYHRDKVINTHPHVVQAAIELCKREGASEIIVAEGPGHWRNAEYLVKASGLGDVLRHHNVPFIDLNHDDPVKQPNLGRLTGLEYLFLARTIVSADVVISLAKLKTHHWAGATLSLKNLFGTLPGVCYGWPKNELHWRGIDNSIVDIALTRTPDLAIVDAIVGMEGDGPINGTARPVGALVMGNDLLAVDATCCRLMKLNPEELAYLVLAQRKNLGRLQADQISQHGEKIETLAQPFETLEHFHRLYLGRSA